MEIKVQDIPPEGRLLSYEENPTDWSLSEKGLILEGPIRVLLKLTKHSQEEVYIRGSLCTVVSSECSRCLKRFSEPVESEFHINYVPLATLPPDEERELLRDDLDLHFYKGEHIDMDEVIEGQLHLAAPMRPLCKPDCLGLCPHCGQDLNIKRCPCSDQPTGPRFSELKNFFKKK